MKKFNVYFLIVFLSFCWMTDLEEKSKFDTFYNRTGTSTIDVIQSDINNTILEVRLEGYELEEVIDNKFLITNVKNSTYYSNISYYIRCSTLFFYQEIFRKKV